MTPLEEKLFQTPAGDHWKKIGVKHHHGIALPLFSLLSEKSCGIGEFLDLIPLLSWCRDIGLDVIQLLPLNDTGLGTSPYNAISAFALNPIYISMENLPLIEKVPDFQEKLAKIRYWNRTTRVKYHIVRELKNTFFREYFALVYPELAITASYQKFIEMHHKWLRPFALFKSIKEKEFWKNWEGWPLHYKSPSEHHYHEISEELSENAAFHEFLQYLCFLQLEEVRAEAEKLGVFLKGDIPILISRDSADVWRYRHYFLLNFAAGAPPDMYARDGQYWGFPVYDWEEVEKSHYEWWKERLKAASALYHLYRIDHIVGFFRLWAIPNGKSAREGSFLPADERQWLPHGRQIMEMMLTAPMFPIGEDLGLVPTEVKQCLYDLGICGTKMMRWERRWNTDGGYIPPKEYQPTTMTTVSTHDSDTLQLWWRHFSREAKLFCEYKGWDYKPFLSLDRHKEILVDSHHSGSLFHINLLQEYLALFPELVAANPNEERINIPGKVLDTNWTYRFRPSVERLIEHSTLKKTIKEIIS